MACALTQGRVIDCRDGFGGIETVYISEFANVSSFTEAAGIVTAMTQVVSTDFFIYDLETENGSMIETHTGSIENGTNFYETILEFNTFNLSASQSQELDLLDQSRLWIIVKDNNGIFWSMGATRAADKITGTSVTGLAVGDMNGYTYSFMSREPQRMFEIDSTVFAGLSTSV